MSTNNNITRRGRIHYSFQVKKVDISYCYLETCSSPSLRVIALGYKPLIEEDMNELYRSLKNASERRGNHSNRTCIEDRLQECVPQTIEILGVGGIMIWIVTGDLKNTPIKIALSTRLISNDGELIHLSDEKHW